MAQRDAAVYVEVSAQAAPKALVRGQLLNRHYGAIPSAYRIAVLIHFQSDRRTRQRAKGRWWLRTRRVKPVIKHYATGKLINVATTLIYPANNKGPSCILN